MANAWSGVASGGEVTALTAAMLEVHSLDILHQAIGVMRYDEVVVHKTELGKQPGETITFTRYKNLGAQAGGRGGELTESTDLETKKMEAEQVSITVTEYGNAIGLREKLLQLSYDDQMAEASELLGRDYGIVRDLEIRDAFVGTGSKVYTTVGASADGQVATADKFDIETLRNALETLESADAPKFMEDFYVCFIHTHQAAYLRRDPDWVAANNYHRTGGLFNGEIGRWEDIVFIQTTHQGNGAAASTAAGYEAALAAAGLDGQHLYRATLIADQCIGWGTALPVEMRDNGVQDFGRKHGLAWYSIEGSGVINSGHCVHIISS